MDLRHDSVRFAGLGLLLALGAPAGWLLVRLLTGHGPLLAELRAQGPLYAYLTLATAAAFLLFGILLGRLSERLRAANAALGQRARTDPLSGLHNRSSFEERMTVETAAADRTGNPLALVAFDLDRFKEINDRFGHAAGDQVIVATGALLRRTLRGGEVPCRVGGDEFAVLCPGTTLGQAAVLADRLRRELAAQPLGPGGLEVTASFGVAERATGLPREYLALRADEALYRAKQEGRNRVWPPAG